MPVRYPDVWQGGADERDGPARVGPGGTTWIPGQPGDSAEVRMRGVLAGDSVAGTWLYKHARAAP
ncbi:MAG TPA: hypothetical protein VFJ16_20750 [Longimicrobium sp.]|nr:hypothetical protein [Longimicrobium sp.]